MIERRLPPAHVADVAVESLIAELDIAPKPGLVSPVDCGSHADMDYDLLRRSAESLRDPFRLIAEAGAAGAGFDDLAQLGIAAEVRMLEATGGINTHRGAIFTLGLLVAAAAGRPRLAPCELRSSITARWGDGLRRHAGEAATAGSHGAVVRRRTGAGGAREEAADGFPSVFDLALPLYRGLRARAVDGADAAVHVVFALVAEVADTNLLHRGGADGAAFAREKASGFLVEGGVQVSGWQDRAWAVHREFVARNLSAGGAADLLAATLFVHRATGPA